MAQRIDLPVEFQFKVEPVRYVRGAVRLRKWWLGYGGWQLQATVSGPAEFADSWRAADQEFANSWRRADLYHVLQDELPSFVTEQLSEPGQPLSSAVKRIDLNVIFCMYPEGCDFRHPPKARVFDPWQLRHDFLHLKPSPQTLLDFLNNYGQWSRTTQPRLVRTVAYGSRVLWLDNDILVPALIFESEIRKEQAAIRDALKGNPADWLAKGSLSFGSQSKFPHYVHADSTCLDAIRTSITIDFLRRVPFRICKRPDCGEPFAADRKGKEYCSQYCAHLVSVRRTRREIKKKMRQSGKVEG
jgi:hypothetical protein